MSATAGVQILLNPAAVSQQAHAIPAIESDLGQGKRGVDGVVQFRKSRSVARLPDLRPKEAAGIKHQPDVLAALHLKNARDEVPPAGSRGPGNVTKLIALAIFSQTVKLATDAPLAPPPLFQLHLTAANEIERLAPGLFEVWKYANGLLSFGDGPSLGQAQRRLIAKEQSAKSRITSLGGHHCIPRFGGRARLHAQLQFGRLTTQLGWRLVDDARTNGYSSPVSKFHTHIAGHSKTGSFLPSALNFQLLRARESQQIPKPRAKDHAIPQKNRGLRRQPRLAQRKADRSRHAG